MRRYRGGLLHWPFMEEEKHLPRPEAKEDDDDPGEDPWPKDDHSQSSIEDYGGTATEGQGRETGARSGLILMPINRRNRERSAINRETKHVLQRHGLLCWGIDVYVPHVCPGGERGSR
jgi:hypothetical protein